MLPSLWKICLRPKLRLRDCCWDFFTAFRAPEKSVFYSTPPDHIFLYQKNIEAVLGTEADVPRQIRDTLLHEVGHYFGLNEEELRGF